MGIHRIWLEQAPAPGASELAIEGEEARHAARVKRLAVGGAVEAMDGRGGVWTARIAAISKHAGDWRLALALESHRSVEPLRPRVEVCTAPPKGQRLAELLDGLSQVGAAAWSPLRAERMVVEPREAKLQRLERVAHEAAKQSGRAWVLEIGESLTPAEALAGGHGPVVICDASGGPYRPTGAPAVRLLVGPEGGWTPQELAAAPVGTIIARFGPHAMRIETAAVAATAIVLAQEMGDAPVP